MFADYRINGYHFRQKGGQTNIRFGDSLCSKKSFYSVVKDGETGERYETSAFMRIVYEHPDYPRHVFVRYIGDETIQNDFLHGNSKSDLKKSRNFIGMKKSLKEKMKNGRSLPVPAQHYRELVADADGPIEEHELNAPRDIKQVQNFQAAERSKLRLSHDGLYNLNVLAISNKFIKDIVTYPDLICTMFLDELWEKVKSLLNRSDIPHVCLQYDTTFNLGDVYVSVLVVRFQEMESAPVISLMMMLHETKTNETHDFFSGAS